MRLLPDAKAFSIAYAFAFHHCSRSLLKLVRIRRFNALRSRSKSWVAGIVILDSIRATDRADIQCLICCMGELGWMVSAAEIIAVFKWSQSS